MSFKTEILSKDIIVIVDGGGMACIFATAVLEVIDAKFRNRVHSVYSTSAGANVGVYFVSGQAWFPYPFFVKYLTRREFIPGNIFSYLYKVFVLKGKSNTIPDFINVDYAAITAQASECPLDLKAFEESEIDFFVKVVNIRNGKASYLRAKDNLVDKLKATSQCGPFSTQAIEIEGERYIDGGTIISDLDVELVRSNPDKIFIYVESALPNFFMKALLYPCYVLAAAAIARLYSPFLGRQYLKELFLDDTRRIKAFDNVICVKNSFDTSTFCIDKKKLKRTYEYGNREAEKVLSRL